MEMGKSAPSVWGEALPCKNPTLADFVPHAPMALPREKKTLAQARGTQPGLRPFSDAND